jgi:hypothetical protein
MRRLFAAAPLLLAACGAPVSEDAGPGLELVLSRAFVDRLGSFQVAVISGADTLDADEIERTCVSTQGLTYVKQDDGTGRKVNARRFTANLSGGQQELKLTGVPFGSEYLFVVEALSSDAAPVLLGSGSARLQSFSADTRLPPISVNALQGADGGTGPTCDPVIR